MIKAVIFDLDGTLVKTEKLKAISYAKAAVKLRPNDLEENEVIEGFKEFVGLSRKEVADGLLKKFDLESKASKLIKEFEVDSAWEAYVKIRLEIYTNMIADANVLLENRWSHNLTLLEAANKAFCKIGLATMSHSKQANRVLEVLEIKDKFDVIATRDHVENGKPNPEIYFLVADKLGIKPSNCLVIEDSPAGVEGGINAGMEVIAVATPFTQKRLHESNLLPKEHIVDEPNRLPEVVSHVLSHHT